MPKVVVNDRKLILNDFFKVEEAHLSYQRFDGSMSPILRRLSFERGDSVSVLIHRRDTGTLLFVNQFRYPTLAKGNGWITELVAGMVDPGETTEAAARREVEEEIGYKVEHLQLISTFYLSPGGSSERIILYYAEVSKIEKVSSGGGLPSEGEDIRILEISLPEALSQVASGQIEDAKTILGILWLQLHQQQDGTKST